MVSIFKGYPLSMRNALPVSIFQTSEFRFHLAHPACTVISINSTLSQSMSLSTSMVREWVERDGDHRRSGKENNITDWHRGCLEFSVQVLLTSPPAGLLKGLLFVPKVMRINDSRISRNPPK